MKCIKFHTLLIFTFCVFDIAKAADLHIGIKSNHALFKIWDPTIVGSSIKSDSNAIAILSKPTTLEPTLGILSEYFYFENSDHTGYYYFSNYAQTQLETSLSAGRLPSNFIIRGINAGASIFYIVGKNDTKFSEHLFSMGLGVSYLNIIYTLPAAHTRTGVTENVNLHNFGTGYDFTYRFTKDNWYFESSNKQYWVTDNIQKRDYLFAEYFLGIGRIFQLN